jgi:hypothetical protein
MRFAFGWNDISTATSRPVGTIALRMLGGTDLAVIESHILSWRSSRLRKTVRPA